MASRLPLLAAGSLAMVALAGCFAEPGDGVFGPASGLGAVEAAAGEGERPPAPFLALKAGPARGPAPLATEFTLKARDLGRDGLRWELDFGDGSPPAKGQVLPATVLHSYTEPGSYLVTARILGGAGEIGSRVSVVVLEAEPSPTTSGHPTQGPEPGPAYASPPASSANSSSGPTSSPSPAGNTSSQGGGSAPSMSATSTGPSKKGDKEGSGSSTSTGASSISSTGGASSGSLSESPSPSPSQTSSDTSSETASESPSPTSSETAGPGPTESSTPTESASESPTPSPSESATQSESPSSTETSSDPPM